MKPASGGRINSALPKESAVADFIAATTLKDPQISPGVFRQYLSAAKSQETTQR
jgi:hypothetical protein